MKKRTLSVWLAVVLALVCSLAVFAVGCGDGDKPEPSKEIKFSQSTNPYANKTWQEYGDLFDWNEKRKTAPVYYVFEGSYSEAYQGDYSRTYLYMNCYEDGTLHAKYGNNNYYGYWTNQDKYGRDKFVLYIVRYNNGEYNDGVYASVVENIQHDSYEYKSSIIWNQWGARTVLIYGFRYSPVKSVSVDTAKAKTEYNAGENFSATDLVVNVTRENGKTYLVEEVTGNYTLCKFTGYDPQTPGEQDITVTYDGGKSTTYKVNVRGPKSISVDTAGAKTEYNVGEQFTKNGLVVKAVMEGSTEEVTLNSNLYTVEGFDSSAAAATQTVTVKYGGKTATFTVKIVAPSYTGKMYNEDTALENAKIEIVTADTCKVTVGEDVMTYGFKKNTWGRNNVTMTVFQMTEMQQGSLTETQFNALKEKYSGLHTHYCLDDTDKTLTAVEIYVVANDDGVVEEGEEYYDDYSATRGEHEISKDPGGGTSQRAVIVAKDQGVALVTYKFWYEGSTDAMKCKIEITEDAGVTTLKFTESIAISAQSGANFGNLKKELVLDKKPAPFIVHIKIAGQNDLQDTKVHGIAKVKPAQPAA